MVATEVDGERSSAKTKHPILTEAVVREALNLLVDRGSIQEFVLGRGGVATPEQPGPLLFAEHEVGVQCRQGELTEQVGRNVYEAGFEALRKHLS